MINSRILVETIVYSVIPIFLAITYREIFKVWVAKRLGDKYVTSYGTNPVNYIDYVGTLIVPIVLMILNIFPYGWCKEVPISYNSFKSKTNKILVAFSGSIANFIMLLMWIVLLLIVSIGSSYLSTEFILKYPVIQGLQEMAIKGVGINATFISLNLIPIPPMDMGKVLKLVSSGKTLQMLEEVEKYGFFIILGLSVVGVLGVFISILNASIIETIRGLISFVI